MTAVDKWTLKGICLSTEKILNEREEKDKIFLKATLSCCGIILKVTRRSKSITNIRKSLWLIHNWTLLYITSSQLMVKGRCSQSTNIKFKLWVYPQEFDPSEDTKRGKIQGTCISFGSKIEKHFQSSLGHPCKRMASETDLKYHY